MDCRLSPTPPLLPSGGGGTALLLIISIQCGYVLRHRHGSTFCGSGGFNRISPRLPNRCYAQCIPPTVTCAAAALCGRLCPAVLQIIKLELSLNNRLSHIGSKRQSWDLKVSPVLFFFFF